MGIALVLIVAGARGAEEVAPVARRDRAVVCAGGARGGAGCGQHPHAQAAAPLHSVDAPLAQALGLERPEGVLVNQVHPRGPAARAGLARGDVILALGGREVPDAKPLKFRLAIGEIGASTELQVRRKGTAFSLELPWRLEVEHAGRKLAVVIGG